MAAPRFTVRFDSRFREYQQELDKGARRALARTADKIGAEAARGATTYRIGDIMGNVQRSPTMRTPRGWLVALTWPDFRAIFFEKGTLGRRRGKLKESTLRRRSTPSGQARLARAGGGVKAVRFIGKAMKGSSARLLDELGRQIS